VLEVWGYSLTIENLAFDAPDLAISMVDAQAWASAVWLMFRPMVHQPSRTQ
jgi:hypothetical protein